MSGDKRVEATRYQGMIYTLQHFRKLNQKDNLMRELFKLMDNQLSRRLVPLAGGLVFISATVHFIVGILGLYDSFVLNEGTITMPVLFILAALIAYSLIGGYLTDRIVPVRAYIFGVALMLLYLIAFADWHVFGYADSFLPLNLIGLDPHYHDGSVLQILVDHLTGDPFALISKLAEGGATLVFILLILDEYSQDQ